MKSIKLPALFFIFISFCGCSILFEGLHSRDSRLIDNFQSHRDEFDQLLEMFKADKKLFRVGSDFTRPEDPQTAGVSPDRIAEYRQLFYTLGLSAGIEGYSKDHVVFYASTRGLSVSGSSKGYAYLKDPPELIVDDLDSFRPDNNYKSYTAFRHIEGNWYLYYDYED